MDIGEEDKSIIVEPIEDPFSKPVEVPADPQPVGVPDEPLVPA
jgi:hypothetical protein